MPKIISIVGSSESGKTTLIEQLIPALMKRGFRLGVIKHTPHGFDDVNPEGKDSWRHQKAGAEIVITAAKDRFNMVKRQNPLKLDTLIPYFEDVDLLITEGYKREKYPKIEVFRAEKENVPICRQDPRLIALVTESDLEINVPRFSPHQVEKLADFIQKSLF